MNKIFTDMVFSKEAWKPLPQEVQNVMGMLFENETSCVGMEQSI